MFQYEQALYAKVALLDCLSKQGHFWRYWIFYQEGEKVIEHGPNPYLALYYVKTENRKEMDLLTEEFYEEMHILDPNGQEVAYHNQIPDYAPAEK